MSSKKDQNWSTSATANMRVTKWVGSTETPIGVLASQTRIEVRKLTRDVGTPLSRREKPYTNKHVVIQYPQGGLYASYVGTTYREYVGGLGSRSFTGGLTTSMKYDDGAGTVYTPTSSDWPFNPDLLSQAEVKAYASLRNKYHEADLSSYITPGIWWGERKETASLLSDAAGGLLRLIRAVRSCSLKGIERALADFRVDMSGNLWKRLKREIDIARKKLRRQQGEVLLGLTAKDTFFTVNRVVLTANLGVAPLLKDLDAAYLAMLQSATDPSRMLIKAHGWEQRQVVGSVTKSYEYGHVSVRTNVNSLVRYMVVFIARPSDDDLAMIERAGLLNVPSTLGELTGLSFIVNYFYPILDYLKAVSTPAAFQWEDGSWSLKVSHLQDAVLTSSSASGQHVARGSYRHIEFRRKVYSIFPVPIPPLSFRHQELDVGQAVNVTTVTIEKVRKALGI